MPAGWGISCITSPPSGHTKKKSPSHRPTRESDASHAHPPPLPPSQDERMRALLNLIEEVRTDLQAEGVSVPGVVVCGDQSSGKSSTLEALMGIAVPRAQGTCTRCPIMVRVHADTTCVTPYALVGLNAALRPDDPSTQRVPLESLGSALDSLSRQVSEDRRVLISREPIHVKVVRNQAYSYNLIDLPGITHNVPEDMTGQASADIYKLTTDLVKEYIKNPEMVILVVIPADTDFSNAAALKLAREVDPEGTRTLGVVTKVDRVPPDHDDFVEKMHMAGKHAVKLKLGFVAVRNRTPAELAGSMSREDVEAAERDLFMRHPLLCQIPVECRGMAVLRRRILEMQAQSVHKFVRSITHTLRQEVQSLERELAGLPPPVTQPLEARNELYRVLSTVADTLRDRVDAVRMATPLSPRPELQAQNICPRAYETAQTVADELRSGMPDFLSDDMFDRIRMSLKEYVGAGLPNLIHGPVVPELTREYMEAPLREACGKLTVRLMDLAMVALVSILHDKAARYPLLVQELKAVCLDQLERHKKEADEYLAKALKIELGWAATLDARYRARVGRADRILRDFSRMSGRTTLQPRAIGGGGEDGDEQDIAAADDAAVKEYCAKHAKQYLSASPLESRSVDFQLSLYFYVQEFIGRFMDTIWKSARELLLVEFSDNLVVNVMSQLLEKDGPYSDDRLLVKLLQGDAKASNERARKDTRLNRFKRILPELMAAAHDG